MCFFILLCFYDLHTPSPSSSLPFILLHFCGLLSPLPVEPLDDLVWIFLHLWSFSFQMWWSDWCSLIPGQVNCTFVRGWDNVSVLFPTSSLMTDRNLPLLAAVWWGTLSFGPAPTHSLWLSSWPSAQLNRTDHCFLWVLPELLYLYWHRPCCVVLHLPVDISLFLSRFWVSRD